MFTVILLICALPTIFSIDYKEMENSKNLLQRLLHLMKNYIDRAKLKINEVGYVRSKYDVSPHFEAGYVVSEILERYRNMVVLIQHHYDYAINFLFDIIKATELIQKLFLEIYHLVNMFHEIARKYSHMPEFHLRGEHSGQDLQNALNKIEENQRNREREKKKAIKEWKKQWQFYIRGVNLTRPTQKPKPKNRWWPIDYGWEINYYW